MACPNFLICGTQKGGTKALLQYLSQHPDISMYPKEINYFSWNYEKGDDWYVSHFLDNDYVGEKSPSYMLIEEVPERIYHFNPKMKLIFILRDPVERAYSHYWMNVRLGKEKRTFSQAIREPEKWNYYGVNMYLSRGKYEEKIERFRKYFPDDQILILSSNELRMNPMDTMRKIRLFLGFRYFEFDFSISTKVGTRPRSKFITKLLRYKFIRDFPLIGKYLQLYNNKSEPYPPMKLKDREYLENYYAKE